MTAPMDIQPGQLFTLGYRGRRLADFAGLLPPGTTVLDVRLKPWSPAPQWQSRNLAKSLTGMGFVYRSETALGNLDYKTGGIRIAEPLRAFAIADQIRGGQTTALLCACGDVAECHRLTVAALIQTADPSIQVVHLGDDSRKEVTP